jgi:alkaline phosphatase D
MTFSGHYSIATGMYPENHGIVDNVFHDPVIGKDYSSLFRAASKGGLVARHYGLGGTERDGLRSFKWLKLPSAGRPRFVALYFDNADAAARRFGLGTPQLRTAVQNLDAAMGKLWTAYASSGYP